MEFAYRLTPDLLAECARADPNTEAEVVKIIRSPASRLAGLAVTTAWSIALGVVAQPAWGFGFGEPVVSSALGQPLRLRIPMRVDPETELTPQCVRLLGSAGSDAIPTMSMALARISIERKGDERILRIDSTAPINEPVLRVAVEAGCAQHTRREFVLLLDPPDALPQLAVAAPLVAAAVAPAMPSRMVAPADPAPASAAPGLDAAVDAAAPAPAGTGEGAPLALGAATITGRMGEALSLQVPVSGSGAASLDVGCVRLAGAWTGEGAPVLSQARLAVVRTASQTQIDLLTTNPVTVPALRVVLEAGCGTTVRREYAVSLDSAAPGVPAAQTEAPASSAASGAAVAGAAQAGDAAVPAAEAPAAAPPVTPPLAPRALRRLAPVPVVPEQLPTAPSQQAASRTALAATNAATAPKPAASPRARPPAPVADRLVLAAPSDQPDPAAQRMADMDKRIADLTKEVTLLRDELAADRLHAAEAAENPGRLGAGWIVAILALLGLGLSGLMTWQRKRSGMPWEKSSWEPAAAAMPATPEPARPVVPAAVPAASTLPMPAARAAAPAAAHPLATPARTPPPLPRTGPLAAFDELTGTGSTLTPGVNPKTTIEVTELHADDPELEKMHTVFLEPGNLDTRAMAPPHEPIETRIPGPRPTMPGTAPDAAAVGSAPPEMRPFPPISELAPAAEPAPMPPPTILAPDQRHGAFTFDEGPYTQTPTMLVLDLDLTTRALPAEDVEIAKFAEAAKNVQEGKDKGAAPAPGGEPRGGYKNGH